MDYNFKEIEKKWQLFWSENSDLKTDYDDFENKKYCLTMFSYPSGDKLHIGHWYNYGPSDTLARYLKMKGFNVFQPQGFDAFGLPAENYAIKHGVHPHKSTHSNISTMKKQLESIGALYNWDKEVITSDKEYYRWTQWLFLKLYENNLAYRKEAMVNWDPVDQTVLANEQVLADGTSDRSGALVVQKPLVQWFFKITDYAEELLGYEGLSWPKKTIAMQKNWIGKSKGARVTFNVCDSDFKIDIFTTRPDTLFGATYLVVAPEHNLILDLNLINNKEIKAYCDQAANKSELQRSDLDKSKTGVFSGIYAAHPLTGKQIPIWIADYVMMNYGTGAIMAVPGHDQRDYEFAEKYDINIIKVVDDGNDVSIEDQAFTDYGTCINSDFLNNLKTKDAIDKMTVYLENEKIGESSITYRLKDWLISRQRYWGTPIPIVYDPDGNPHPIPDEYLPWTLPDDVEYKPKGTSPLGSSKELLERTEKIFGKGWKPEIDTMDTFVCSSWYYLRYPDSANSSEPFSYESTKWLPVDYYIGGAEHATMHLLYARFITKALNTLKIIDFNEPFTSLYHQGTITKDGAKMSKSKGNTVSPDIFLDQYGSDTFRCYLMFMGPYDEGGDWNDKGIKGISKFLSRAYRLCQQTVDYKETSDDLFVVHSTIQAVTNNLDEMKFNTALSRLMEFVNYFYAKGITASTKMIFIQLLSPLAPHISEELWSYENNTSVFISSWPICDSKYLEKDTIKIMVQVNGKLRASIEVDKSINKDKLVQIAKENQNVSKFILNKEIIREIYVPNKIINIVIKE
ncbi:MAG: leucine--tRNA ligase [Candidatus Marinimicrobia bacterium]|nr:leucine--tRNA ligase [Candidatus Neomarinimicrobiota bacterium]|tara:strand:- start:316 stop:2700 length:2385 start_codon:yes stop_codon:yes gene_type:complete